MTESQRIESIYILPLLGQAAGHSETDLLCVPQFFNDSRNLLALDSCQ